MRIYTRNGDGGETDLLDGIRVEKDSPLLEVCGTFDELNAAIGLVRCDAPPDINLVLERIQRSLFRCGSDLLVLASRRSSPAAITAEDAAEIEQTIDRYEAKLKKNASFILPAGCRAAAALHLARTVCRRAERRLFSFSRSQAGDSLPHLSAYINRLGDLLYVLARAADAQAGVADSPC